MAQMTFAVAAGPLAGWPSAAGLYIPVKYVPGSKGRLRCTPTSTPGHAASNCTLPPKIVHGVDQATTGMVRPVHVCCGVVFHATPVDGVDGVPALRKRCASVEPHRFTWLRHRAGQSRDGCTKRQDAGCRQFRQLAIHLNSPIAPQAP